MSGPPPIEQSLVVFENVSRFYGEVLGVNRVTLSIPPGITSLVGPNGSGKTTLMNLMTGLVRPTRGSVRVLGVEPDDPEKLFRLLGYATQFDSFPKGLTGFQFVYSFLRLFGTSHAECEKQAWKAIERVNLVEAANRKVAGYSKGMRQRIKLAQSIAHAPRVLVLDEPLNGLDPLVLAARVFEQDSVVEARVHADGGGLLVKTRDADRFYKLLNRIALDGIEIETVAPADDNVNSVYEYLIGGEESTR